MITAKQIRKLMSFTTGVGTSEECEGEDVMERVNPDKRARDAGAAFINRQWIAEKIHRITRFVTEWWEKSYDQCFTDYSNAGCKLRLSQASGRQGKREGLKPFHVIAKPLKTETHISNRLWLCDCDEENVIDPDEVTFVHDKAPCMRANKTQHLLQDNNVKFWGNGIWPGNLPDLNVAERIGSIMKDEVEKKMLSETGHN
ncbi:unnamed protein product [Adineta ricciae]|uniref:Uncharacterized protein n=1 Tax=Adineta ricciae TaxID=249248 RepID=A0A815P7R5_ADIRI|nr:unnamed protein product [Adineta ricciae]CAF1638623.1 unnamed protein product [Adineta ricciae]